VQILRGVERIVLIASVTSSCVQVPVLWTKMQISSVVIGVRMRILNNSASGGRIGAIGPSDRCALVSIIYM